MNEPKLFGYGTFRDPTWRKTILGADYPWEEASLAGWRRVAIPRRGYLSIEPSDFDTVEGVVVELDDVGWRVADAWEEVPIYRRIQVDVRTTTGLVAAYAYVCDETTGAQPYDGDGLALIAHMDVERSILAFTPTRDALRRLVDDEDA